MKAYVRDTGIVVEALGQPAPEVPICNRPLRVHQEEAIAFCGLQREAVHRDATIEAGDGAVILSSHVYITRRLLRRFVAEARRRDEPVVALALPVSPLTRLLAPLGRCRELEVRGRSVVVFEVWFGRGAVSPAALSEAPAVIIDVKHEPLPLDNAKRLELPKEAFDFAISKEAVVHVRHWVNVLIVNQVGLFVTFLDLTPALLARYVVAGLRCLSPLGAVALGIYVSLKLLAPLSLPWTTLGVCALVLAWLGRHHLRRLLPDFASYLALLTRRGRRCRIHPTAVVEASILGDDVEIGPGARVFGAVLGNHAKVDAAANVFASCIGERSVISVRANASFSVVYPRTLLSRPGAQITLVGEGSAVLSGAFLMDLLDPSLRTEIKVLDDGALVPSGHRMLGVCVGPGVTIGAGVTVRAGVVIPAGSFLVMDPHDVVRRVVPSETQGAPLVCDEGTALDMAELLERRSHARHV